MDKFSTFLLGAVTGAIALGVTACICESTFTYSSCDEDDDLDDGKNEDEEKNGNLSKDSLIIVR